MRLFWSQIQFKYWTGLDAKFHCIVLYQLQARNFSPLKGTKRKLLLTFMCFSFIYFYSLQAGFYVVFLLLLSYSLMHSSTRLDPTHYKGIADSLHGVCEIVTLVMVVFYICEEINQMRKLVHNNWTLSGVPNNPPNIKTQCWC